MTDGQHRHGGLKGLLHGYTYVQQLVCIEIRKASSKLVQIYLCGMLSMRLAENDKGVAMQLQIS